MSDLQSDPAQIDRRANVKVTLQHRAACSLVYLNDESLERT